MSKSRNEKKPPAQAPPVATTNDIIPGKFNENQWNFMIEQENSQELILDILDEILDCTIQVIHEKYIQSQLQPYSVDAAKDLLLQIIESRFLEHDVGEVNPANDVNWLEDEEPVPCVTDSWSQGSVPVQRCESRPLSARSQSGTLTQSYLESPDISPRNEVEAEPVQAKNDVEPSLEQTELTQACEPNVTLSKEVVPSPPPTARVLSPGRRKHVTKSTGKKTKQSNRKKMTPQVIEQSENNNDLENTFDSGQVKEAKPVHQIRTSRAPGEQEVTYDEQGNIVAMMRLSVDKLPSHRIRPRYEILDPQTDLLHNTTQQLRKTKKDGMSQLGTRQGHFFATDTKKTREKQMFKSLTLKSSISLEIADQDTDEIVKPLPPPLADSMDISAGVVVREGQLVRKGPNLFSTGYQKSQTDILNLQPVGSLAKRQTISVSDVIGNTSPVIRQMRLPDPIPPIAHRG